MWWPCRQLVFDARLRQETAHRRAEEVSASRGRRGRPHGRVADSGPYAQHLIIMGECVVELSAKLHPYAGDSNPGVCTYKRVFRLMQRRVDGGSACMHVCSCIHGQSTAVAGIPLYVRAMHFNERSIDAGGRSPGRRTSAGPSRRPWTRWRPRRPRRPRSSWAWHPRRSGPRATLSLSSLR